MPPKKADPQAQKKQFQAYRQTEEWRKIQETYNQIKSLHYISQTSKDWDFDGKYQILWDLFYQLAVIMKVKPPFKKIQHQWIRSLYFGQKKKFDAKDVPLVLDGLLCQFQAVDADSQHNLRQALIKKIYNAISDKDNFDIQNYVKTRAQLKKGFTQFFNLMKNHIKKSFKVVYDQKLLVLLQPFSNLLEINMKLVLYELKYITNQEKFVNDFKYQAIKQRYCTCMDKILQILSTHGERPVKFMINPKNVFKKLQYANLSKVQSFYLTPYRNSFDKMKQGLCALFTTGVNFWKVPTQKNVKFTQDLLNLINWQLIVQRFFGTPLLKDQINFVADVLSSIAKANQLAQRYMIKRDPNAMQVAIPRLIAFKTIQRMRLYKDKQSQLLQKQREYQKMMGTTKQKEEDLNSVQQNQSLANITKSDLKNTSLSKVQVKVNITKLQDTDPVQKELDRLGRYWIWQNYCDEQFKNKVIEKAVQDLKHINPAVHQDIQDAIIRDGMLPRRDRQNQELKGAAQTLKHMKTLDNSLKTQNMRRPPQLWNFPKVVEQQHKFRSIADPKKCYIDGRIERLDNCIVQIGEHLRKFNQKEWNELIRRVIDFYSGQPDPSPFSRAIQQVEQKQQED